MEGIRQFERDDRDNNSRKEKWLQNIEISVDWRESINTQVIAYKEASNERLIERVREDWWLEWVRTATIEIINIWTFHPHVSN